MIAAIVELRLWMNDTSNSNNIKRKWTPFSGLSAAQKKGGHCSTENSAEENNSELQLDEEEGHLQIGRGPNDDKVSFA